MTLRWRGEEVKRKMDRAVIEAMNTTMDAAVLHARSDHRPGAHARGRFETQTGSLERSVRVVKPARKISDGFIGRWGSTNTEYALRIEMGFEGKDAEGRVIKQRAYPYLRPAAQHEYPKLAKRIKREFAR